MELIELHVGELGAGTGGEGDAVAGSYCGIRSVGVDLARATGGNEDCARGDSVGVRDGGVGAGYGQVCGDYAATFGDEAGDHGPLGEADSLVSAGEGDERAADFSAGGVAAGVENAGQRMSTFASAEELAGLGIEVGSPLNELGYAEGSFRDKRFGGGAVNYSIASVYGVFEMEGNVLIAFHGDGDSALCVVGVGLAEGFLGDYQDIAVAS
jgi:hypothetical protein